MTNNDVTKWIDQMAFHIETEITEEHPKIYTKMHLIYKFQGNDLPLEKIFKIFEVIIRKILWC
jgi:uncharacterized OsmC-like protein